MTSSVTGTAKNVAFSQNTNGSRTTFQQLSGASGGTDAFGIGNGDYIQFIDSIDQDANPMSITVKFEVGTSVDTATVKYIDISSYTGTDEEKSEQFWNDLSQSIKDYTAFDNITISSGSNIATFHITSSITGTVYNNDIQATYSGSDGYGFFSTYSNTQGGTDPSGASVGDTITIGSDTFTIVHNSSPTSLQINASGVTDEAFFNAMSAAIKVETDYDLVTWTSSSATASFSLTSSTGTPPSYT